MTRQKHSQPRALNSSLASPGEQQSGEAESGGQGEVGPAETSEEKTEEGEEAGQVGGRPGEAVGGEEVGQARQGGEGEDRGPAVRTVVLEMEPLTKTSSQVWFY